MNIKHFLCVRLWTFKMNCHYLQLNEKMDRPNKSNPNKVQNT